MIERAKITNAQHDALRSMARADKRGNVVYFPKSSEAYAAAASLVPLGLAEHDFPGTVPGDYFGITEAGRALLASTP